MDTFNLEKGVIWGYLAMTSMFVLGLKVINYLRPPTPNGFQAFIQDLSYDLFNASAVFYYLLFLLCSSLFGMIVSYRTKNQSFFHSFRLVFKLLVFFFAGCLILSNFSW